MGRRLELHEVLVSLLGSRNVYFQPPPTEKMRYPCIVYQRTRMDIKSANDLSYSNTIGYTITLIDANPDSLILEKIARLPMCRFDRHFTADNLNHDVFTLYY